MLSSHGKWQFMLLVGCLGTALCWNGSLLTLGRNFLTHFFQLTAVSNHYTECSPPPPPPEMKITVKCGNIPQQYYHEYSRHTRRMPRHAPKPQCV
jgi:hypothetical protein